MSAYRYRVKTTCTAYVGEEWIVTSARPLTDEEVEEALMDTCPDDVTYECVEEDVDDEHDRSVDDVTPLTEAEAEEYERASAPPELAALATVRAYYQLHIGDPTSVELFTLLERHLRGEGD